MQIWRTSIDTILSSDHQRFYCEPGERVENQYEVHYDKNGVRDLRCVGKKKNTFDMIQADVDSCDVKTIIEKYFKGDFAALNKGNPMYLDITEVPETYAEFYEISEAGRRYFYSLDPEVRKHFNNSYEQFLNSVGTGKVKFDESGQFSSNDVIVNEVVNEGGENNAEK